MKAVLDHLIATAPEGNDGAAEVQVILKKGAAFAGATKHSELGDGIYEMITMGQNQQTREMVPPRGFQMPGRS
jgi:hypothetical protein